ncbi:MAG TPA: hypothetical protein IGS52_23040 [Oscillatoriaceae cyanobacterium M33_DOE_052]|uniref:Uncharacterized protein n=1 Tax=Planktothricoides sp. SpSt-374 TaxID=2282167 RepID=A0A7C3VS32_9CYAN|nr:hypothetical protein [Oscillatoriaceae cyanobacterium M33_DOE_052]
MKKREWDSETGFFSGILHFYQDFPRRFLGISKSDRPWLLRLRNRVSVRVSVSSQRFCQKPGFSALGAIAFP